MYVYVVFYVYFWDSFSWEVVKGCDYELDFGGLDYYYLNVIFIVYLMYKFCKFYLIFLCLVLLFLKWELE